MATATADIADINLNNRVNFDANLPEMKNKNNHYFYSSGSFNFILDKGFKPETLEDTTFTAVPFLPSWHQGIVSIHGLIMPVIDILSFVKTQNINIIDTEIKKPYLLKLEHKDYDPVVFKLDALPRLINIDDYEKTDNDKNSPDWITHYLKNASSRLAFLDHRKLFDQIINAK